MRMGELRAGMRRLLPWSWLPVLLVVIFTLLRLLQPRDPEPAPQAAVTGSDDSTDLAFTTLQDTVHAGDTFSGLLLRNSLGMQDITRVLTLNRRLQLFSPRTLRPGQVLTLTRDEYGRLSKMAFEVSAEEIYVFEAKDDDLIAYLQPVDKNVRLRKLEGEIETTFDDAVRKAGGDYRLTLKLADIFAYDVDFFTEVQRGDRFSVLVEERFADDEFLGYGEVLYGHYDGDNARSDAVWFGPHGVSKGGYYDLKGQALRKVFLRSPLNFRRISSFFSKGRFHPILRTWRPHKGVDYAAAQGTPVVAVADGVVRFAGWKGGYGRFIELRHDARTATHYGHLSRFARGISSGARVSQGEVIGFVGATGLATGAHLHYEVVENGVAVNPLALKNLPAEPIAAGLLSEFTSYTRRLQELDSAMLAGQVLESFQPSQLQTAVAQLVSTGSASPVH
jgi:murein DD-endopeptidase MepM/ murein hydrolase activator NlpD